MNLNSAGESTTLALIIPLFNPGIGAHGLEGLLEVIAGFIAFSTFLLAAMVVDVRLVAVTGHVLVGETWIEGSSFQLVGHC